MLLEEGTCKGMFTWREGAQLAGAPSPHVNRPEVYNRSPIGLTTVFDAILTGRQSGQKLQCLYGNPIANNFFQNGIFHNL